MRLAGVLRSKKTLDLTVVLDYNININYLVGCEGLIRTCISGDGQGQRNQLLAVRWCVRSKQLLWSGAASYNCGAHGHPDWPQTDFCGGWGGPSLGRGRAAFIVAFITIGIQAYSSGGPKFCWRSWAAVLKRLELHVDTPVLAEIYPGLSAISVDHGVLKGTATCGWSRPTSRLGGGELMRGHG